MDINKVVEEWKIWDNDKEAARLEEKVKKLVLEQFYKWIKIFRKKASKRIPIRKI